MTNLKITISSAAAPKKRREKPIDWDNATDHRLLSIAMNSKDPAKIEKAMDTLVGRSFVFSRKQAQRLLTNGVITNDNIEWAN